MKIMPRDASSKGPDKKVGWQTPWDRSFVLALDKETGDLRWKAKRGLSRIGHVTPTIWKTPGGKSQVISSAGDVVQGFDAATGNLLWSSKNMGEGVVPSLVLGGGLVFATSGWGGRETLKAFRLGESGDLGHKNLVWEEKKGSPKVPSVIYLSPYLYAITDGGVATCYDGKTGKIVFNI